MCAQALGDHGNSQQPPRPTGRISVEKFQYVLRTVLRQRVKDKMKAAYQSRSGGLRAEDPLVAIAGIGTFPQNYGIILTVILHINDVPCCWTRRQCETAAEILPYPDRGRSAHAVPQVRPRLEGAHAVRDLRGAPLPGLRAGAGGGSAPAAPLRGRQAGGVEAHRQRHDTVPHLPPRCASLALCHSPFATRFLVRV